MFSSPVVVSFVVASVVAAVGQTNFFSKIVLFIQIIIKMKTNVSYFTCSAFCGSGFRCSGISCGGFSCGRYCKDTELILKSNNK